MKNINFFLSILQHWYATNQRSLPFRGIKDPYKIWVSEILLQQTQMSRGVEFYKRFIKRFPTIQSLAKVSWEEFLPYFEGLGYYNRGRNMLKAAQVIMQEYKGKFPKDYTSLIKIPGIGPYTANAILSFAFDEPVIPLDTNVKRLLGRVLLGVSKLDEDTKAGKNVLEQVKKAYTQNFSHSERSEMERNKVEESMYFSKKDPFDSSSTSSESLGMTEGFPSSEINQAMMDFCSAICFQAKPKCLECCFQKQCLYFKKEIPHLMKPIKAKRLKWERKYVMAEIYHNKKLLDYKGSLLGGFLEKGDERTFLKELAKEKMGVIISVRPAYKTWVDKNIKYGIHRCYVLAKKDNK